jgi:hypothetical protein
MRATMAAALVGAVFLLGGEGRAQGLTSARTYVGTGGPVRLTPGYSSQPWAVYNAPAPSTPSRTFYYSYYAAPGVAAREYVGSVEFPFYGRPYGHPNDRWSWANLSGGDQGSLARYYYPPVR